MEKHLKIFYGINLKVSIYMLLNHSHFIIINIIISTSIENLLCHEQLLLIARNIGTAIGRMHDADVVHGDLTTSNIMVSLYGNTFK